MRDPQKAYPPFLVFFLAFCLSRISKKNAERRARAQSLHHKLVLKRLFVRIDLEALAQMQPDKTS
jgi:hypothetical protein